MCLKMELVNVKLNSFKSHIKADEKAWNDECSTKRLYQNDSMLRGLKLGYGEVEKVGGGRERKLCT